MTETVGDIGEDELMRTIIEMVGPNHAGETGPGDDAAVALSPGETLLYTTDALVESVDFRRFYCSGADVGWKAMAVNVSDVAAMGGRPIHALATLFLTPATEIAFIEDMMEGVLAAGDKWGVALMGGDISRASDIALSIAMVGVADHEAVLRSRAIPGDAICVTGSLGGAAGGLYLLQKEAAEVSPDLAARQLRPQARAEEGIRIARAGAHAMIDVSDGFLLDLSRLLRAGGVGCKVDPALVPVDPQLALLQDLPGAPDPRQLALSGGEDFELIFTIDPGAVEKVRAALAELGTTVTVVGEAVEGRAMFGERRLDEIGERGWDHLKDL